MKTTTLPSSDTFLMNRFKHIKNKRKSSFGITSEYKDIKSNNHVAIKKVPKINNTIDARVLLRQLRIMRKVKHKGLLQLKSIVFVRNKEFYDFYLVSDLYQTDLHKLLKHASDQIEEEHVQYILYQILSAVSFLHNNNLIHRDIEPSNILINENCDVVLDNYGLAREVQEKNFKVNKHTGGSGYKAPEIVRSTIRYDKKIDLWSTGCCFYELLRRKPFFKKDSYSKMINHIYKRINLYTSRVLKPIQNNKLDGENKVTKNLVDIFLLNDSFFDMEVQELLKNLLNFDPKKRISASDAIKHPYLRKYLEKEDLEVEKVDIDFSFETDLTYTFEDLKLLILEEVNLINADVGVAKIDIQEYKYYIGVK